MWWLSRWGSRRVEGGRGWEGGGGGVGDDGGEVTIRSGSEVNYRGSYESFEEGQVGVRNGPIHTGNEPQHHTQRCQFPALPLAPLQVSHHPPWLRRDDSLISRWNPTQSASH